jgi:hypothetical protein
LAPRGEMRTPLRSIEMVTSRPSLSFFSITIPGGSRSEPPWAASAAWAAKAA